MTLRDWTAKQRLTSLMRLPWSIHVERDEADGSLVAQVGEIPDAIATGASMRELAKDLWESLAASLEIRLEHGDMIPLPAGSALPWETESGPNVQVIELRIPQAMEPLIIRANANAV